MKPKSPLFWILLAGGVGLGSCCLMTTGVLALGALADDEPSSSSNTGVASAGGEWLVAGEIARGSTMAQSLPGARWVAQNGSIVNNVVARTGNTQWVQTNSGGAIHELVFDDDGSYVWNWGSSITMYGQKSESHCKEKGSWALSGTQLTLTPDSQHAEYSNSSGSQEKNDENLGERQYSVIDLTLETLDAPKQQVPALLMTGPKGAWDTGAYNPLSLTLQRLQN